MNIQIHDIALIILAYLMGSIPFGLLIVKFLGHGDIRNIGSGNIGATNVRRTVGTFWGVVTLIGDVLKGMVPILLAIGLYKGASPWLIPTMALTAIVGHMFPIYLAFKPSGKGVATALGCFIIIAPGACGLALMAFLVTLTATRVVSVASMVSMVLLPLLTWLTKQDLYLALASGITAMLIVWRHKSNIQRLLNGKESSLGK